MKNSNIDYRDLISGVILSGIGVFVAQYAKNEYEIGNTARIGPGFFPVVLGWLLCGLGVTIIFIAIFKQSEIQYKSPIKLRPMIAILASIFTFSLLVAKFGLIPAAIGLTLVASAAEIKYKLKRTAILAVSLSLISWLIFTVGLQMTLPAFNF